METGLQDQHFKFSIDRMTAGMEITQSFRGRKKKAMTTLAPSRETYTKGDLKGVPEPPDWRLHLEEGTRLPKLQRPLNVSCPCIGMGNAGRALAMMGVKYNLVNSCDLLPYLEGPLKQLEGSTEGVALGEEGDIMSMDVGKLDVPTDMLVAGPPCPPFASNGKRQPEGVGLPKRIILGQHRILVFTKSNLLMGCIFFCQCLLLNF